MRSQHTGRMIQVGFLGSDVEHAAVWRASAKAGYSKYAEWVREVLMKAAAAELGLRDSTTLDRNSPAYGKGFQPLTDAEKLNRSAKRVELDDVQDDVDAVLASAIRTLEAQFQAAKAGLEAASGSGHPKPRRRR